MSRSGIKLLKSAADAAEALGELPPHHDAIVGALALCVSRMLRTSPDDEADNLAIIARLAARQKLRDRINERFGATLRYLAGKEAP